MSRLTEILPQFVQPRSEPWSLRPFGFKLGLNTWSVVFGGPWLVAVPGKSPFDPLADPPNIDGMLKIAARNSAVYKRADLLAWAGAAPSDPVFARDANDPTPAADTDGIVAGVAIDRRRLAYLLQRLDVPEVVVWDATEQLEGRAIGILAQHWRLFLAGVDMKADEAPQDFPRFPPASPEEDLFALAMSME